MGSSESRPPKSLIVGDEPGTTQQAAVSAAHTSSEQAFAGPMIFSAAQDHSPKRNIWPDLSIEPITSTTVPSFRRIISLLLPIRYPDKFFAESVANVTASSLARVAIWRDRPRPAKRKREENVIEPTPEPGTAPSEHSGAGSTQPEIPPGIVIGGIQCRFEQLPFHPSLLASPIHPTDPRSEVKSHCYIQTLALLSPYRSKGIATALIEAIITTLCVEREYAGTVSIYAHVWEANEEALGWYVKRGFQVGDVVQGYYRRLKPAGARIVWRDLKVEDYLRTQAGNELSPMGA